MILAWLSNGVNMSRYSDGCHSNWAAAEFVLLKSWFHFSLSTKKLGSSTLSAKKK